MNCGKARGGQIKEKYVLVVIVTYFAAIMMHGKDKDRIIWKNGNQVSLQRRTLLENKHFREFHHIIEDMYDVRYERHSRKLAP